MPLKTAVLFFTRQAKTEAREKRWMVQPRVRTQEGIASRLIAHTRGVLRRSGLPVIYFPEHLQRGAGFAERFISAFDYVFSNGYESVICVGNDSPDLTVQDLHLAAAALESRGMVLGPARDGGVYLIGFQKASFDAGLLLEVPWKTDAVFGSLQTTFPDHFVLPRIYSDLDHDADMRQWIQKSKPMLRLRILLRNLLIYCVLFPGFACRPTTFFVRLFLPARAPPC